MTPTKTDNTATSFTHNDRKLIEQTASQTQEILNCLFGCPADPTKGLFHLVNLNTRFRQNMTKLLWILIPVILSMAFTLITMHIKP